MIWHVRWIMGLQACLTYSLASRNSDTQAYMILGSLGIFAAHRYAPFGLLPTTSLPRRQSERSNHSK